MRSSGSARCSTPSRRYGKSVDGPGGSCEGEPDATNDPADPALVVALLTARRRPFVCDSFEAASPEAAFFVAHATQGRRDEEAGESR